MNSYIRKKKMNKLSVFTILSVIVILFNQCGNVNSFYKSRHSNSLKHTRLDIQRNQSPNHNDSAKKSAFNKENLNQEGHSNELFKEINSLPSINLQNRKDADMADGFEISGEDCNAVPIEYKKLTSYLPASQPFIAKDIECAKATNLSCSYNGNGSYTLTWTVTSGYIYTANGTLDEFRIRYQPIGSSKFFTLNDPEPICADGSCSITLTDYTHLKGYNWIIETRCSATTIYKSNMSHCNPGDSDSILNDTYQTVKQKRKLNKKALFGLWFNPVLFIGSTLVLILMSFISGGFAAIIYALLMVIGQVFIFSRTIKTMKEIEKNKELQRGKGLAVLGLILSLLFMFVAFIFAAIVIYLF
jgi:hypothetical protein